MKPKIPVVDDDDNIIGYKSRNELTKEDTHRVSALWITNSQGEILLARRHHTKLHNPGKWGPAAAGTAEKGKTYEENILKEAEEELGLKNIQLTIGPKIRTDNEHPHFSQWYFLNIDRNIKDFTIQKNEVEEIKWFSPEELGKQLQEHPEKFLPNMPKYYKLFSLNY